MDRFTSAMGSAVAQVQRGVSVASLHLTHHDPLQDAYRQTPCVAAHASLLTGDTLSMTLCLANGTARWECDGCSRGGPAAVVARRSPELDALVNSDERFTWSTVASSVFGESTRLMSTSHFLGEEAVACEGEAPFALSVHTFCGSPDAPPRLWSVDHVRAADDRRGSLQSLVLTRPSVEGGTMPHALACQLAAFVEVPALCSVLPHSDPRPRRLERVLREAWGGGGRSGFVSRTAAVAAEARAADGARPPLVPSSETYGELSAEGVVRLLEGFSLAQRAARAQRADEGRLAAEAAAEAAAAGALALAPGLDALAPEDTFVDVGSGVGKVVVGVAILTGAISVGLEVVPERARRASAALADAVSRGLLSAAEAARVALREVDATREGALPRGTTHVYLSNLCFPLELTREIVDVLTRLPHLRCVAALRKLPEPPWVPPGDGHEDAETGAPAPAHRSAERSCPRLQLMRSMHVPMTWDDRTEVHIYCCV
jgi:hypothetical protein